MVRKNDEPSFQVVGVVSVAQPTLPGQPYRIVGKTETVDLNWDTILRVHIFEE